MKTFEKSLLDRIIRLLPNGTPRRLSLMLGFQIMASLLDVVALLLIGFLSKSGLDYIQGINEKLAFPILDSNFNLFAELEFEQKFAVLGITAISLLALRTFISIWGNKKILFYLGNQSGYASSVILRRLFESKPSYVLNKNSQEVLYNVTNGIDTLVLSYLGSLVLVISETILLLMVIVSLLIIQPITGLCALIIFGSASYFIHNSSSRNIKKKSEESADLAISINQQLLDSLRVYRELLLRGKISQAAKQIQTLRNEFLTLRAEIMFLPIYSKFLFEFVLILGSAIVATVQLLFSDANTAIASVVVFLSASSRILPSVVRIQGCLLSMKQSEGAGKLTIQQVEEMNRNFNVAEKPSSAQIIENRDASFIEIKEVSFAYPESNLFQLSDINIQISKGQFVAIVGESGAGKSTLADIILGIQEPTRGEVYIRGSSPKEFISKFPGQLAYVPQDISIIEGDVSKNLTLIQEEISFDTDAKNSLTKAALWEDIAELPKGINTFVGERGMKLSGGQRQRIGIARALFTRPQLIIFDEATSSLDPLTEKVVTDAIYDREAGLTLIVIAHRLSTVKNADLVLYLEKGKLIASGSFDDVRNRAPRFDEQAKLVNL
jgi:ATP-binding cassette, subfamily B, bacterial PglK